MSANVREPGEGAACGRCWEDFPVLDPLGPIRMGSLYPAKRFRGRIKAAARPTGFLCGNCWFDLTDEGGGDE